MKLSNKRMSKPTIPELYLAFSSILDICPKFTFTKKVGGYHLIVEFGSIVYNQKRKHIHEFTEHLGQFICSLPPEIKEKYLKS